METNQANKMLKKFVGLLTIIIMGTLVAMFAVSFAAGFALKDSQVAENPQVTESMPMTGRDGTPVSISVTESDLGFWALPTLTAAELAAISTMTAYVDMTTTSVGSWVEYSTKLAAVYKAGTTMAMLETFTGHVITIDAAAKTASIVMSGSTYPMSSDEPASLLRRRMAAEVEAPTTPGHPRRRARRGAFLSTNGAFKMSSSSNRGGNT